MQTKDKSGLDLLLELRMVVTEVGYMVCFWIYLEGRACRVRSQVGHDMQERWKVVSKDGWKLAR